MRPFRVFFLAAVLGLVAGALFAVAPAEAYSRIFNLHLENGANNAPVTFRISTQGHNCYEGNIPIGSQIGGPVAAGGRVTVTLARIQGHDCDGEQGHFAIELSSQPGAIIRFNFSNGGILGMTDTNSRAFGVLSGKNPYDESYTWRTHDRPKVTAGRATGTWIKVCQQLCNKVFKTEIVNTTTNTTETSTEIRNAVSATLETGVELGAFSAGGSVTTETEKTTGTTMSQELSTSSMTGTETTVNLSREEMEDVDVFAVWQWVATTRLSNGNDIVLTTVQYTCTPDARMPRYLPGSREDIRSCRKRKQANPTPVATAPRWPAAPQAPVAALDPSGSFQHQPVQNDWHVGQITREGSGYRWTNKAGASWTLYPDYANNRLQTGTENPYYQQGFTTFDLIVSNGRVNGFSFGGGTYMRAAARAPQQPAAGPVPVSAALMLQSDRLPMSRTDPAHTTYGLDLFPAIYLTVQMSDGSSDDGFAYKKAYAQNVVFDDVGGDPYDLIKVVYWDIDSNNPGLGKYAAQLTSTGRGVGNALLNVSFRNAPGVTASVPVTVVSNSN